jgi:diketogulonate reductase-like aldo/keto reductase
LLTLAYPTAEGRCSCALEEAHIVENISVFDFSLSNDEMRRISALRKRNIRIADPPERGPKWDVETVA